MLGITHRTYLLRLNGKLPEWTVSQLIKISSLNEGKVKINMPYGDYEITIKEADKR